MVITDGLSLSENHKDKKLKIWYTIYVHNDFSKKILIMNHCLADETSNVLILMPSKDKQKICGLYEKADSIVKNHKVADLAIEALNIALHSNGDETLGYIMII